MAKLNTKEASATHRIIIYGPPKSGKSLIAGKLAEHYNLIWFDLENGHGTLFRLPEEWKERIELIDIPDTRSFPMAIETCLKVVKGPVDICEEHGKVGCMICKRADKPSVRVDLNSMNSDTIVVFDSSTQLTNSAIAHITKAEPEDYKLKTDDYGHLGKLMDVFYSHVQQAPYNVIVISHESEIETEGKKKTLVPVAGTRNFSRNVAKYFDHVIYAERKNKKHVFASSTTYATNILTGSRTDVTLEGSAEPSLLAIFKPELYAASEASAQTKIPSTKGSTSAADILARLTKATK